MFSTIKKIQYLHKKEQIWTYIYTMSEVTIITTVINAAQYFMNCYYTATKLTFTISDKAFIKCISMTMKISIL